MQKFYLLILVLLLLNCQSRKNGNTDIIQSKNLQDSSLRSVNDNIIISDQLPKIELKVDDELKYVGSFDIEIIANSSEYTEDMLGKPIATGERYVFASTNRNKSVDKLFIIQFEGFLPTNDLIYNYNFSKANYIGKNRYRHNTWYFESKESIKNNPNGEWAKTISFLTEKGFQIENEIMMSRFVGLASPDRKHEIILFYHELLKKSTGYTLEEWNKNQHTQEFNFLDSAFIERSKSSFKIIKG